MQLRSLPSDSVKKLVQQLTPSAQNPSDAHFDAPYAPGHGREGACLFGDDYTREAHKRQPGDQPTDPRSPVARPRTAGVTNALPPPAAKTRGRKTLASMGDDALLAFAATTLSKDV